MQQQRNVKRAASIASMLVVCALILFRLTLNAQVVNGVNGTVTDSSGAVVAGATVRITDTATGVVSNTLSSSTGSFAVVGVIPGTYSIEVSAPNFATVQTSTTVEAPISPCAVRRSALKASMQSRPSG